MLLCWNFCSAPVSRVVKYVQKVTWCYEFICVWLVLYHKNNSEDYNNSEQDKTGQIFLQSCFDCSHSNVSSWNDNNCEKTPSQLLPFVSFRETCTKGEYFHVIYIFLCFYNFRSNYVVQELNSKPETRVFAKVMISHVSILTEFVLSFIFVAYSYLLSLFRQLSLFLTALCLLKGTS